MVTSLDMHVKQVAGTLVVWATGEADHVTAPALRQALVALAEKVTERVVVDLSGLSFIDSSGLSALIAGYKAVGAAGRRFCLAGLRPAAARMFKITNVDTLIPVYQKLHDALTGHPGGHDLDGRVPVATYLAGHTTAKRGLSPSLA